MQLGRVADRFQLALGQSQLVRDELSHSRHVGIVRDEVGVALRQGSDEYGLALVARRPASAVLAFVHAMVGDTQGVLGLADVAAQDHAAVRVADRECPAVLAERLHRGVERAPARLAGREHTEFVAPEAVGRAGVGDGLQQPATEAREQCVAGQMTEGVVVGLEAVEVKQREERLLVLHRDLEVAHQLAAVGQTGEAVRSRGVAELVLGRAHTAADILVETPRHNARRAASRHKNRVDRRPPPGTARMGGEDLARVDHSDHAVMHQRVQNREHKHGPILIQLDFGGS